VPVCPLVCPPAVWQGSDAELLAELGALETRLHSTWAQMFSVVSEIDSRSVAGGLGYGTTVELVRVVVRASRGEARARIAAAADVLPGRGLGGAPVEPRLPATAAAVAEQVIGHRRRRGDPLGAGPPPPTFGCGEAGRGGGRGGPPRPHPGCRAVGGIG
jgi:hypothetical protein